MTIIYTSFLAIPKTKDNKLAIEPFENTNNFITNLKNELPLTNKMIFITNRWQPKTPAQHRKYLHRYQ